MTLNDPIIHCQQSTLMLKLILLGLLAIFALARDNPKYDLLYRKNVETNLDLGQQEHVFRQVTDHYDYRSVRFFDQRYWTYNDYYNPSIGPIFIYLCGQWVCEGIPNTRTWLLTYAQRLQGMVIALEHRFYGDSLPFGKDSFSIKNMGLLNSEQALRDTAYFIQTMKDNEMYGIKNNPWIVVGGSYPGALSAWFRYKYPHLVIASIASSAVIQAIEDMQDFDQQIYLSSQKSGDYCSQALNASSVRVENILKQGGKTALDFKSQFQGGQNLKDKQFLFFWADTIVLTIQYGGRTQLCNNLKGKSADDQFDYIVQNAKHYAVYEYSSYQLRNQTFAYLTKSMARPWYYQYCTQYAFFQTFSQRHPMRSQQLTLEFFSEFCSDSFGPGTWPKVQRKNTEYGALDLQASKILFANGIEDPWRWASLQETDNQDLIARIIDCDNCAHCVDMYTPLPSDPQSLKKVRNEQYLYLQEWIDEYWRQVQRTKFQSVLFGKGRWL